MQICLPRMPIFRYKSDEKAEYTEHDIVENQRHFRDLHSLIKRT